MKKYGLQSSYKIKVICQGACIQIWLYGESEIGL